MKNFKKLATILLALVMVLSMATTAFAATITVTGYEDAEYAAYKILDVAEGPVYTIKNTSPWYADVKAYADVAANGMTLTPGADGVTYTVTVVDDEDPATTDFDPAAFAEYLKGMLDGKVADGNGTIANNGDDAIDQAAADITVTDPGYYFVTTNVGALCILDTANANAAVTEKNEVPTVDKKITTVDAGSIVDGNEDALAQVGTDVAFTATITVGANVINYVYRDTMTSGLTFKNDVVVTVGGVTLTEGTEYNKSVPGTAGETFSIAFDNEYILGLASGTEITITYSATINENAITSDVETNTASLTYGNDPGEFETPDEVVEVYDAKIVVNKVDGNDQPLAGAGFVLQNAGGKYYKNTAGIISWVDAIADATELTTAVVDGVASVEFVGLADGTYTLIEKTVPAGYNQAANQDITIAAKQVATLTYEAEVINQAGSVLPSTGGIGTTIFYISGAVLAIAAVVFLVTKKRMSGEEE